MKMLIFRCRLVIPITLLLLAMSGGCRPASVPSQSGAPSKIAMGGARSGTGTTTIHAGSIFLEERSCGVAFAPALSCHPGLEFSWVILCKHRWNALKSSSKLSPVLEEDFVKAKAGIKIELDGVKFDLLNKFQIDRKTETLSGEILEINGKPVDVAAGRVFLVDLTTTPSSFEQVKVDLSGVPTVVGDIEAIARALLEKLAERGEKVQTFVASVNQ